MLTRIGTENLVASYAARFEPDPDGDGYRFFADDLGEGVPCSAEQRDAYVRQFTRFIERRTRFQWFWLAGLVICSSVVLAVGAVWLEWPPVVALLDRDDDLLPAIGALLTVLPLAFAFKEGIRLYRLPILELGSDTSSIRRRRPARAVFAKRVRGMSDTMVGLLIVVPLLGLVVNGLEIFGGERSVLTLGGFGVVFIAGCAFAIAKRYA